MKSVGLGFTAPVRQKVNALTFGNKVLKTSTCEKKFTRIHLL